MPTDPPRLVRVFVSSTFRDMHAEREELAKRVFPQLRKLCETRGVAWAEVDLRWGVTEREARRGEVVPVCLAEISRCQPFFIGLLGERYGWVPDDLPPDLVEQLPWLAHAGGKSVTELEILHAVLNNPAAAPFARFYFRDPAAIPYDQRATFTEGPLPEEVTRYGAAEAERRADERRRKLVALKDRIRRSGLPVREYPDARTLGECVLADLTAIIDRLYPDGTPPDPLAQEAADHEAFAASRTRLYVGRPQTFETLATAGPAVAVVGEPGIGKSALLANWVEWYRAAHPGELVISHHVGATPTSTNWAMLLRRVMTELKRHFHWHGEVPDQPEALRAAFPGWLERSGRVTLVIDAVDQLDDRDGARDLTWLPEALPANVRVVVSTRSGRTLDAVNRRGWPTLAVTPRTADERTRLTVEYLRQYAKKLTDKQVARIAAAPAAGNPLYLRALLEELRLHGNHETLNAVLADLLTAVTPEALFDRILARYERDYDRDRPGLVRDALVLLWATRGGLAESELLDLLAAGGPPVPRAYWSPFYLALEPALVSRQGLLAFSHDYLRRAVESRYLADPAARRAVHHRLAEYFRGRPFDRRAAAEVPWQLAAAESWRELAAWLTDPTRFLGTMAVSQFDVRVWWAKVETGSPIRMADEYRRVLADRNRFALSQQREADAEGRLVYFTMVAGLLHAAGHVAEAEAVYAEAATLSTGPGSSPEGRRMAEQFRSGAAANQALIRYEQGDLAGAMELAGRLEHECRARNDTSGLAVCLRVQGLVLAARGETDAALDRHQEVEHLSRKISDPVWIAQALADQAGAHRRRGEPAQAMRLLRQAETLYRQAGRADGVVAVLNDQAVLREDRHDYRGALAAFREAEAVCRQVNDAAGRALSLVNQGGSLRATGDLDGALTLFAEAEAEFRRLGNREDLARCLGNRANVYCDLFEHEKALPVFREQEAICRELGLKDQLALCLGNQADCFVARGDYPAAHALAEQQERLARETGNRKLLAVGLINQANGLFDGFGRKDEALEKAAQAIAVFTEAGLGAEALQAQQVARRIQMGLTQRTARRLGKVVPVLVAAGGIALGFLNPWLWLLGGPMALIALGMLAMMVVMHNMPRLRLRILGFMLQWSADRQMFEEPATPAEGTPITFPPLTKPPPPVVRPVEPAPVFERVPLRDKPPRVGRNDPCPCGSGKRYKNCHMKLQP